MEYLAHSAKDGGKPQTYTAHVEGVVRRATEYAEVAENYATNASCDLRNTVQRSATWHDLGKLDDANQSVLNSKSVSGHLPINHVDAGSAAFLNNNQLYEALAVYSHHRGLPNISAQLTRETPFRDDQPATREHTDDTLSSLIRRHNEIAPNIDKTAASEYAGDQSVYLRMLLSCLADADHTDTAESYGQYPADTTMLTLRAAERLCALDRYVGRLSSDDERGKLRSEMYKACREAAIDAERFVICDSPVGSGKTTAVMAYMLHRAEIKQARRIFVILPYTSIIQQSVDVYRKALVLPGEDPETIVAELHCRADFQNADTRYLTALWRAPIVVTTAVAFFETLASNRPSTLRRLHELSGSIVFVDESHNALPLKLLPLAWRWMNVLADEWSCEWVLASGSLVRFWQLDPLKSVRLPQPRISQMVEDSVRDRLMTYEGGRVQFCWKSQSVSRDELEKWIADSPGPRLLIVNTVQSAAVIANDLSRKYGRDCVEHLSTALAPMDRDSVIKRVRDRLQDTLDVDWTLVATSCVEAGVDFSFRTGFRELSSLLSLLQASGRVNRHGNYQEAQMWSFVLQEDSELRSNPVVEVSREVLKYYLDKGETISPDLSTQSIRDELIRDDSCMKYIRYLEESEENLEFQTVNDEFKVIDSNTITVIVDDALAEKVAYGYADWRQVQRFSVSIRRERIKPWNIREIAPELYQWTLRYDDFLGYMSGVLDTTQSLII